MKIGCGITLQKTWISITTSVRTKNLIVVFIFRVLLFLCLFVLSEVNITVTATALCWFVCVPEPCYAKNFWHSDELQAFVMVLQPIRSSSKVNQICLLSQSTTAGPHTRKLEWDQVITLATKLMCFFLSASLDNKCQKMSLCFG